jgi:cytochrome P450
VHFCLGAKFAKFETGLMLEVLAERLPSLRLVEQAFDYFPNITFRGPEQLHLAWD